MLDFAGHITVIAPETDPAVDALADEGSITVLRRRFDESDLENMDMVLISTGHAGTDVRIAGMCRRLGIPVNAASDRELCDFYFPGIARKDPLVVGITASGEDHRMAAEATAFFKKILKDER
jgi:siroheme synthase-like protein